MRNQLDIFKDDPVRMAKANREAAVHALHDRQFTESERQERAAYYTREAERWANLASHCSIPLPMDKAAEDKSQSQRESV